MQQVQMINYREIILTTLMSMKMMMRKTKKMKITMEVAPTKMVV